MLLNLFLPPTYYIALFQNLTKGEVISGNQIIGPLEVVFKEGPESKNYVAKIEDETFIFEEIGTLNRIAAQMNEHIKILKKEII